MALSAATSLILLDWQTEAQIRGISSLFGAGGLVGYPIARLAVAATCRQGTAETRFAAHLLSLTMATICVTATLYALEHRAYFTQWHAPFPSVGWSVQFLFTMLGALYQFAALGLRLYLPVGLPALLIFALWLTARTR